MWFTRDRGLDNLFQSMHKLHSDSLAPLQNGPVVVLVNEKSVMTPVIRWSASPANAIGQNLLANQNSLCFQFVEIIKKCMARLKLLEGFKDSRNGKHIGFILPRYEKEFRGLI